MKLAIVLDEKTNTLYADLTACEEVSEISSLSIRAQLEEMGYKNLKVDPKIVSEVCNSARQNTPAKIALKILVDAAVEVSISSDKRKVELTLTPADGGKALTLEGINNALNQAGVVSELRDSEKITQCFERKNVKGVCVANARLPLPGQDAQYEALVDDESYLTPQEDEDGVIDLLSLHQFTLVEPNTPLMRRIPAVEGTPGLNVTGEEISPPPPKDPGFSKAIVGALVSSDDPNLLVAQIKGHPILIPNGVSVDPVLHVDNVDVKTGNITFDGSLDVKGDIKAGMHVNVTGDIHVKGLVERAWVKAKHDIVIKGGIFGSHNAASRHPEEDECSVVAGGNIETKFANQVVLHAGKDLVVKEYIGNCVSKADAHILLGQQGGKGALFGGFAEAKLGVAVVRLGNDSYAETRVSVGTVHALFEKRLRALQELKTRQKEIDQLTMIIEKVEGGAPIKLGQITVDKTTRIRNTITAITQKSDEIKAYIAKIEKLMAEQKNVFVSVTKAVYPNVEVVINGAAKRFSETNKGDTWRLKGSEISGEKEKV